jgi:glycogen phosphorylase
MNSHTRVSHPILRLLPAEVEGFDSLAELALDMCWSWSHSDDDVWREIDPELWQLTRNPWVVSQTVSRDRLKRVLAEPVFRKEIDDFNRRQTPGSRNTCVVPAESFAGVSHCCRLL